MLKKIKIINKAHELVLEYNSGIITAEQYQEKLIGIFNEKSPQQWIDYYDEYIKLYKKHLNECERRLNREKKIHNIKKTNLIILLIGAIFISFFVFSFLGEKEILLSPNIRVYVQEIGLSLDKPTNYTWNLENTGQLISLKISGSFIGDGNARIYLQDLQGDQWLIFDSENIVRLSPEENLTGENITEENVSIPLKNETLSEENTTVPKGNETLLPNIPEIPQDIKSKATPKEILIDFSKVCEQTCNLTEFNLNQENYILIIEIENLTLNLDTIDYEIVEEGAKDKIAKKEHKTSNGKKITTIIPEGLENTPISVDISSWNIHDADSIRVYWEEGESEVEFITGDLDKDGKIDTIEWSAPAAGENNFEIIIITNAEHLDSERNFISNIYEEVKELDDVWSETIQNGDYVRVIFKENLTSENDITIYPRIISGNPRIEIYEFNSTNLITEFTNLSDNQYNKILLTNLETSQDTFDILVLDGEIEIDHIVDPVMRVKTGISSYTAGTPAPISFIAAMSSTSYAILFSGGEDPDAMFALEWFRKATTGFSFQVEDDTGANETSTGNNWAALEYGEFNFSNFLIKCNTGSGASTAIINFITAFPNTNYAIVAYPSINADSPRVSYTAKTTGSFNTRIESDTDALIAASSIDWCAVSYGSTTIGNTIVKAGFNTTSGATTKIVGLGSSFPNTNYAVVTMASMVGLTTDPCEIEISGKTTSTFNITAEDDDNANNCANREFNWIAISTGEFNLDTDPPIISNPNTNATIINQNDYFCLNITATDSSGVSRILAEVWNTSSWLNYTMTDTGTSCSGLAGDNVYGIAIQGTVKGLWNYSKVYANDTLNNWNSYDFLDITINVTAPQNQPPIITINSVDIDNLVDLIQGATTPVEIVFNVTDANGYADINDSSVLISFNYDTGGEPTRSNFSCLAPTNDGLNTKTYTCRVNMSYYDAPGTWTATVNVSDFLGPATGQNTRQFNVNLLRAVSLSPPTIGFGNVIPGNTNVQSLINTTITNEGNFDIQANSKLQIISKALIGQINPLEVISGNNFKLADQSVLNVCLSGINLIQDTPVDIPNIVLPRGPSSTREVQYCLTSVPVGISAQDYSASGLLGAWDIRIVALAVLAIPAIEKRKKKKIKQRILENEEFLEVLTNNLENLLGIVKERRITSGIKDIEIPLSIFKKQVSPAEVLCKYLKENKGLKFNEIAIALNRDQRTIWINYRNSVKKDAEKIKIDKKVTSVPIKIFSDRKLSVLESVVKYLKDKGLSNSQISEILGKTPNNIWTLYSRAINKLKNKT